MQSLHLVLLTSDEPRLRLLELIELGMLHVPLELVLDLLDLVQLPLPLSLVLPEPVHRHEDIQILQFSHRILKRTHVLGFLLNPIHLFL